MVWKKLKLPGVPCEINEYGQIREKITVRSGQLVRNRIVPHVRHGQYWGITRVVNGKQRNYMVHRLVAQAFLPNPKKLPVVEFIDGNRDHTYKSNLRWVRWA